MVVGNGSLTEKVKFVDVGALQANPQNKGATFQVASNFNCLELVSSSDQPRGGISKYVYDLTQGFIAIRSFAHSLIRSFACSFRWAHASRACRFDFVRSCNIVQKLLCEAHARAAVQGDIRWSIARANQLARTLSRDPSRQRLRRIRCAHNESLFETEDSV
jgi:hypothetical protein